MWKKDLLELQMVQDIYLLIQQTPLELHFLYHNDKFFGLARSDYIDVFGKGYKENGQRKSKDTIKKELAL